MRIYDLTQKQIEKLVKESKDIIKNEKIKNDKEEEKLNTRDKFIEYAKAHFNPSKNITIIGTNTQLNPIYLKQFNDINSKEKNILKEFLNEGITNYFIISEKNKDVSLLKNVLETAQIHLADHLKFFKNKELYEFYGVEKDTNFSINENKINSNIEFKNNKVKLSKLLEDIVNKNIEDSFYVLDEKEIKNNLLLKYMNLNKEVFGIIFLDKYNQVIKHKNISEGTIDYSFVYERELIKEALNTKNLKNIVIHHNHPSGSLTPSKQDIDLTRKLIKAFKMLDIGIVDHLIIGKHDILSLKNKMKNDIEFANFKEIKMSEKEKVFKKIEKELVIFPKSKLNNDLENSKELSSDNYYKECFEQRLPEYIDNHLDYIIENINDGNITETYEIVDYITKNDNINSIATMLNNKLNEYYEDADNQLKEKDALKYTLYEYLSDEGYELQEEYQKEFEKFDEIIVGNLTYDDFEDENKELKEQHKSEKQQKEQEDRAELLHHSLDVINDQGNVIANQFIVNVDNQNREFTVYSEKNPNNYKEFKLSFNYLNGLGKIDGDGNNLKLTKHQQKTIDKKLESYNNWRAYRGLKINKSYDDDFER